MTDIISTIDVDRLKEYRLLQYILEEFFYVMMMLHIKNSHLIETHLFLKYNDTYSFSFLMSRITVETTVNAPVAKVWQYWTAPEHIMQWNNASPDWHTPRATTDLKAGGKFSSRMEAKDGSVGFDFEGIFSKVVPNEVLEYGMADGRTVSVLFKDEGGKTHITESFDAETENSEDMQRAGWQAILDNFKKHAESQS